MFSYDPSNISLYGTPNPIGASDPSAAYASSVQSAPASAGGLGSIAGYGAGNAGFPMAPTAPTSLFGGTGAAGSGFGFNAGTLGAITSGIGTIGNLWNAFQAQKLAKEQFAFTKDVTNTNLNNSIKSYNTSLDDRIRARGFTEGQSQQQQDDYITKNQLSR